MAPKPDQMQLEKQKTAAIQRTQQAAEQTSKMNYYHGFMERFKYMEDMGLENRSIPLSEAFKKFDPGPVGKDES